MNIITIIGGIVGDIARAIGGDVDLGEEFLVEEGLRFIDHCLFYGRGLSGGGGGDFDF